MCRLVKPRYLHPICGERLRIKLSLYAFVSTDNYLFTDLSHRYNYLFIFVIFYYIVFNV